MAKPHEILEWPHYRVPSPCLCITSIELTPSHHPPTTLVVTPADCCSGWEGQGEGQGLFKEKNPKGNAFTQADADTKANLITEVFYTIFIQRTDQERKKKKLRVSICSKAIFSQICWDLRFNSHYSSGRWLKESVAGHGHSDQTKTDNSLFCGFGSDKCLGEEQKNRASTE